MITNRNLLLVVVALALLAGCGERFTTAAQEIESFGGLGGVLLNDESTGGSEQSTGGAEQIDPSSGGATGGTEQTDPEECEPYICGSVNLSFNVEEVHCYDVEGSTTAAGNLVDSDSDLSPGDCVATLDGEPVDVSQGLRPGRLIVWGCNGWLNCY